MLTVKFYVNFNERKYFLFWFALVFYIFEGGLV